MRVKYVGGLVGYDTRLPSLVFCPGEVKDVSDREGKVLLTNKDFVLADEKIKVRKVKEVIE
jgi:hypothetical protein